MKSNVKKLIIIALYTAMMVVLSIYGTINLYGIMKITLQNLPLIIAAISLGTGAGTFVGFMGSFLNQLLTYGFTPTTLIWVLPHTIIGFILGFIFEKKIIKVESGVKFSVCIIASMILLTLLNTIPIYIDLVVFGTYNIITIFGALIIRLMSSTITAIVYSVIIPVIIKLTKKIH